MSTPVLLNSSLTDQDDQVDAHKGGSSLQAAAHVLAQPARAGVLRPNQDKERTSCMNTTYLRALSQGAHERSQ